MFRTLFYDFYSPLASLDRRIFLIDFLRFMAIALMVYFHLFYDLDMLGFLDLEMMQGSWFYLPRVIVTLFLLSSGMSLNLSKNHKPLLPRIQHILPRFFKLAFFAIIISLITKYMFPNNWVYFGTLHCLAALSLIAVFFQGQYITPLVFGVLIQANYFFNIIELNDPLDFVQIKSVDYIPLYPWTGVFLIGMGIVKFIPRKKKAQHFLFGRGISIIAQKSLPIYLIHQPFIFSTLWLVKNLL